MSTEHTPGPWQVQAPHAAYRTIWIKEQNAPAGADFTWAPRVIATINPDVEHAEANARLIAAAPDTKRERDHLLADCNLVLALAKDGASGQGSPMLYLKQFVEILTEGIAKAKGGQG